MSFHFIFAVDYISDKNVLYGTKLVKNYQFNQLDFIGISCKKLFINIVSVTSLNHLPL